MKVNIGMTLWRTESGESLASVANSNSAWLNVCGLLAVEVIISVVCSRADRSCLTSDHIHEHVDSDGARCNIRQFLVMGRVG
jgi:hypothetical protein